jgi:hypothetical protein
MKLIIAGSRDRKLSREQFWRINTISGITEIVSGGCRGVDASGEDWASLNNIPCKVFKAEWTKYKKAAGPIRNKAMAMYADAVVLFPGGTGTESMYQQAVKFGLKIYDWR